ncbi:MAG: aldo/keto reductase [Acidobacteria bacterium]|nr:aldo/keto reductase [Acidobacteriota bacterium]
MPERRRFGSTDLDVSPVCLGTNVFGWTCDEETSFAVLDAYVEAGGNFLDTATVYSTWVPGNQGGESEAIIGRWLASRGRPDDLVIATKVGYPGDPHMRAGLDRENVRAGIEGSLERLGVESIDLYYAHKDDESIPLADALRNLDELKEEGLVRYLAASNYSPGRLAEALDVAEAEDLARFQGFQPHFNLLERVEYQGDGEDICVREHIGVAPYFTLARGFLTGKYRPGEDLPSTPRAGGISQAYLNDRGWAMLAVLDEVAAAHDATPGQVALAWLMRYPGVVSPIASATGTAQVHEMMGAVGLELTDDEFARLDAAGR